METKKNIREALDNISFIPTLPTVISQLTSLLQNPKTSAEEIGKAITTDQALASKVLKLVNSAFYGFPGKISTITHAIVILGFSTIKNVVLTATIFDAFKRKSDLSIPFDIEQFWLHSVACGSAAQSIAKYIGFKEKEACFIAGLIHDLGKIILYQYLPLAFIEAFLDAEKNKQLFFESETQLFDITHQEIGAHLAEKWNLPLLLQNAIKHHHNPQPNDSYYTSTAIVHCADILVRALDIGDGGDKKIPCVSEHAWKFLGLDKLSLHSLFDAISEDIRRATIFVQFT